MTHGRAGELNFTRGPLNTGNLETYRSLLTSWKTALQPGGGMRILGCRVAQNHQGHIFLEQLSALLEVPTAASVDDTGPSALGANWILEATAGGPPISAESPFDAGSDVHLLQSLGWNAGNVALLQVEGNGSNTALIKFATLTQIQSGNTIVVTDLSWVSPTPSLTTTLAAEGSITLTALANIPAGQIFTINVNLSSGTTVTPDGDSSTSFFSSSVSGWTLGSVIYTTSGDNVFIYAGSDTSPKFLFGLLFTTV